MKNITVLFISLLLLAGCNSTKLKDSYEQKIYNTKPAFYSYIIGNTKDDKIYAQHNADVFITPASSQKALTTALAFKELGQDFTYKTKLLAQKQKNTITSAAIVFSGDFTLTSEDLLTLLAPLKNKTIKGGIILDASAFQTNPYSENLILDDIGTQYARPVSPIIIDNNLIKIAIGVNEDKTSAFASTDIPFYPINLNLVVDNEENNIWRFWGKNSIQLQGNINTNSPVLKFHLSPIEIKSYALYKVEQILKQLNIKAKISIVTDNNNSLKKMNIINMIESKPLKEIIAIPLQKSINLPFESIYLTMVNKNTDKPIEYWYQGDDVMKMLIKKHFALDLKSASIYDGSGVSRYNRIKPRDLLAVLQKASSIEGFIDILPLMEDYEKDLHPNLLNTIRVKPGTMSGIKVLVGYYTNKNNEIKTFAIFAQGFDPQSVWMDNYKSVSNIFNEFATNKLAK